MLNKPVSIRLYRQFSIRITERYIREVFQPFNRYNDRGSGVDLNATLAWQSGHRPLIRANNYGLDGAFPTKLQPSLLRVYEWVFNRWYEFLQAKNVPRMSDRRIIEQNGQRRAQPRKIPACNTKPEKIIVTRKEKDSKQQLSADIPPPRDCRQGTSTSNSDGRNTLSSTPENYAQSLDSSLHPCSIGNQVTKPWNKRRWAMSSGKPLDPVQTVERSPLLDVDKDASDVEDARPVKRRLLSREWK